MSTLKKHLFTEKITSEVMVEAIRVELERPVRNVVLRPNRPFETTFYPGDEAADSFHAGAYLHGKLCGVASVIHESPPGRDDPGAWRLCGVAVLQDFRSKGLDSQLVQTCIDQVKWRAGSLVWCRARSKALDFYRRLGFQAQGDEFSIPESGPHFLMARSITVKERKR